MRTRTIVTATVVALILANGILPLAYASPTPAPAPSELTVIETEIHPTPDVERDTYDVTEPPTIQAPALEEASGPRPYEGPASVKSCRAALNGYVVCIGG